MPVKKAISPEVKMLSIFKTHNRFLRSTNLERDWHDPSALDNYTFTQHAGLSLERISSGLQKSSSLRAWRITGDYGSGKSSFALLLANVFSKRLKELSPSLKESIVDILPNILKASHPKLIPVLITGAREALGYAILKALLRTLKDIKINGVFFSKLEHLIIENSSPADEVVLDWVKRSITHIIKTQSGDGLALIIDEAGKFLEYAAIKPEKQDINLLQALAEMASRSAKEPFYIISIFHQGISSYSEGLSRMQQREWEKIAGRYEEIIWHYPVEQTINLIATSLNSDIHSIPKSIITAARKDMQIAVDLGWYGLNLNKEELFRITDGTYPIHSTVIPILIKLFSKFGQNERSLYSFLLGTEPFGLQDFAIKTEFKEIYRLHNLYDYARNTFGSRLGSLSYHWKAIDSVIRAFDDDGEHSIEVLKTCGIINLINSDDLVASKEILSLSVGQDVSKELLRLQTKHYLHYRGRAGGFCVWPNTSVNLEEAYEAAKKNLGNSTELKSLLRARLEPRPLVARRHYIETGNLRYFEVRYVDVENLAQQIEQPYTADGLIIVPLCETQNEIHQSTLIARTLNSNKYKSILIVIPPALQYLSSFLDNVRRWEWILHSIGELRQDRFAREEVSRQLNICQQELQKHLQSSIGFASVNGDSALTWFHNGKLVRDLSSGKKVMSLLTEICNDTYPASPCIKNELINRRELSSAGALARLRLCERLFEHSTKPYLGMDPDKHPPEMSMYLSVLQEAGLHRKNDKTGFWNVGLPHQSYDNNHCKVLPSMSRIHEVLTMQSDKRVPVAKIFDELRQAPYGVRDGVIPLLLAVFAVIHEQEIAFYEDGSFIARISGSNFLRLIKAPETFEVQYYPITGIRSSLFNRLIHELGLKSTNRQKVDILDVVKPMMIFMSGLPEYVLNTSQLTPLTQAVRSVLRTTVDPIQLLFYQLPVACGLRPISENGELKGNEADSFVDRLKGSIDELRGAYAVLLEHLSACLFKEFNLTESFEKNRQTLAERAGVISGFVTEIGLKSFCLRLSDKGLSKDLWIESLGNLLCSMPPSKWRDKDRYKFDQEIHKLSSQFLRVEATLYKQLGGSQKGVSVRVALTRPNGEERDRVVHLSADQAKKMIKIESQIKNLLLEHGQIGMAAASEVLWQMMTEDKLE